MTDKEKFIQLFKSINYQLIPDGFEDTDLVFLDTNDHDIYIAFDQDGTFVSFYSL